MCDFHICSCYIINVIISAPVHHGGLLSAVYITEWTHQTCYNKGFKNQD